MLACEIQHPNNNNGLLNHLSKKVDRSTHRYTSTFTASVNHVLLCLPLF